MREINEHNILVTGGSSMIGRAIIKELSELTDDIFFPTHSEYDLLNEYKVWKMIERYEPYYIIHCAGFNGNLQFTKKRADDIFWRNTTMAMNLFSAARSNSVNKVLSIIPSCAYPPKELLREEEFWDGSPHPSVFAHAIAKRNLVAYGQILSEMSDTKYISVVLNNCTGPYDNFDIEKTKVFGGLIAKFCKAVKEGKNEVECYGDGSPLREYVFSEDAATGIVKALQMYEDTTLPLNIGWGVDYSIKEIAEMIAVLSHFTGEIVWNKTYPNGAMKKLLDVNRMRKILEWEPQVPIIRGLEKTIRFYRENYLDNC